jgi:hypothetical protein
LASYGQLISCHAFVQQWVHRDYAHNVTRGKKVRAELTKSVTKQAGTEKQRKRTLSTCSSTAPPSPSLNLPSSRISSLFICPRATDDDLDIHAPNASVGLGPVFRLVLMHLEILSIKRLHKIDVFRAAPELSSRCLLANASLSYLARPIVRKVGHGLINA